LGDPLRPSPAHHNRHASAPDPNDQGAAPSNFERALPLGDAEAAQALTRDPLIVDFIPDSGLDIEIGPEELIGRDIQRQR
jgi:hypothetical protein